MASTEQRIGTDKCARCRKEFQPGDRVVQVLIVVKTMRNPKVAWERGAMLSPDFELAHVACADPGLEGKIITTT